MEKYPELSVVTTFVPGWMIGTKFPVVKAVAASAEPICEAAEGMTFGPGRFQFVPSETSRIPARDVGNPEYFVRADCSVPSATGSTPPAATYRAGFTTTVGEPPPDCGTVIVPTRNERAGRVGATGVPPPLYPPARYETLAVVAPEPSPAVESFT